MEPNLAVRTTSEVSLARLAADSAAAAYIRSLPSDTSRRTMMQAVSLAAEILAPGSIPAASGRGRAGNAAVRFEAAARLPWHQLQAGRLGELRAELLQRKLAPATVNRVLAAMRGVLKMAWANYGMDMDKMERGKVALQTVRGSTEPRGKHLNRRDLAALFESCARRGGNSGSRDAALIALLATGIRRAEVAALRLNDYEQRSGRLLVRGKGNKERTIFLTNGCKDAVDDWLKLRGTSEGSLLLAISKSGQIQGKGITPQAVYAILRDHSESAGVKCTPHDMRRTCAGEALNAGIDAITVQSILGHASPATTARYDQRPLEARRKAMELLTLPYKRG
jgi:integrase/recombinase XerD